MLLRAVLVALFSLGVCANYVSIDFSDNSSLPAMLLGDVIVSRNVLATEQLIYNVFWATGNTFPPQQLANSAAIVVFNSSGSQLLLSKPIQGMCNTSNMSNMSQAPCPTPIAIPAGATHLLVRSYSAQGSLRDTNWTKVVDWTGAIPVTPAALALKIEFTDTEQDKGILSGSVSITTQSPEALDVEKYRVWFYGKTGKVDRTFRGGRAPWVSEVLATGYGVQAAVDARTVVPGGATQFCAYSLNRDGATSQARCNAIYDIGYGDRKWESVVPQVVAIVAAVFVCFILLILIVRCRLCFKKPANETVQ